VPVPQLHYGVKIEVEAVAVRWSRFPWPGLPGPLYRGPWRSRPRPDTLTAAAPVRRGRAIADRLPCRRGSRGTPPNSRADPRRYDREGL